MGRDWSGRTGPGGGVYAVHTRPGGAARGRVRAACGAALRHRRRTYPQPAIWRVESLADADLELVHESMTGDPDRDQTAPVHEPIIVGDRIHIMTPKGVLISDEDGRTWTEITWR